MAFRFRKFYFVLPAILLIAFSCDKRHAKKLAGTYSCTVHGKYYLMGQYNVDTIFFEDLKITQDDKNIVILGKTIHVDSLWKEKEYKEEGVHFLFKVLFKKDSIYITNGSGGLGGYGSNTYSGLKKK